MKEIVWNKLAEKDYQELDGSKKILVDKGIDKIKVQGMQAGKPLKKELHGYREIKHRRAGLRTIFTETDNKIYIEIVAVGKREDGEIFKIVKDRIQ